MTEAGTKGTHDPKFPLASVVVNNYNYARFLGEAIDSALEQTYAPLEVVVVDDGSTDDSRAVIDAYRDRIIPVLQENGGMASALNTGFRACRGEIVVFLDSDDLLLPTAVARAADLLRDPLVAKAHWSLREIDAAGRDTGHFVPRYPLPEGNVRDLVIETGPMSGNGPPTSGNAWSRRFLEHVLPMPEEELRQHADAYLNTLSGVFGALALVAEPQGCYRLHGANDYATEPMLDRLRRNMRMYHYRCRLLSVHLRSSGVEVHPTAWKTDGSSYYSQLKRRLTILREIAELVPPGDTFVLADGGAFGGENLIADRRCLRFPPSDGRLGLPASAEAAIEQLERLRADGAGFLVVVRAALWWLRRCDGLRAHLDSRYTCELATGDCVAFGLR